MMNDNIAIEKIEIKKLKLLERNPRKISKQAFKKCLDSLQNHPDFIKERPILVHLIDGVYQVYAGNMRVRAAKKLGWKTITCSISINLSDEEIKQRVIMDNAHYGEPDYDMLASDYEISDLLAAGFTELQLNLEAPESIEEFNEIENIEKPHKCCPHCGGEL